MQIYDDSRFKFTTKNQLFRCLFFYSLEDLFMFRFYLLMLVLSSLNSEQGCSDCLDSFYSSSYFISYSNDAIISSKKGSVSIFFFISSKLLALSSWISGSMLPFAEKLRLISFASQPFSLMKRSIYSGSLISISLPPLGPLFYFWILSFIFLRISLDLCFFPSISSPNCYL